MAGLRHKPEPDKAGTKKIARKSQSKIISDSLRVSAKGNTPDKFLSRFDII